MKRTLFVLLAVAACGPGRTTFARYPGAAATFDRAASDPKAVAVADKVISTAGGMAAWEAAKQVKWSETITVDGKAISGEEAWDRWDGRQYGRLFRQDGDIVVMRDLYGDKSTVLAAHGEHLRKIDDPGNSIDQARQRWEFDSTVLCMPFLLEDAGAKLAYGGETKNDAGQPLDDLVLTFDPKDPSRKSTYHVLVNRTTSQIERIEIKKPGQAPTARLGYHVTSYAKSGGLTFPTGFQNIGYQGEVITFKDVSVGSPDDQLYIPPLQ